MLAQRGAAPAHVVRRAIRSPGVTTCTVDAHAAVTHDNVDTARHRDENAASAAAAHATTGGGGSTDPDQPAGENGVFFVSWLPAIHVRVT